MLDDTIERAVQRARKLLWYASFQETMDALVQDGHPCDVAYLATKAAVILNDE